MFQSTESHDFQRTRQIEIVILLQKFYEGWLHAARISDQRVVDFRDTISILTKETWGIISKRTPK